jgi:hypothetical protein
MITHDVKTDIKNHFGFNAFHTTPINIILLENLINPRRYRRKKSLYVLTGFHRLLNPQTTCFFTSKLNNYNIATAYINRSFLKCI